MVHDIFPVDNHTMRWETSTDSWRMQIQNSSSIQSTCVMRSIRSGRLILPRSSGFTMIEVAIMLVIIGLLLGGVLKGQELITSARVRNLIMQQDDIKAGFYGFQDRFRALPGDYTLATANIPGLSQSPCTGNGDGNGRIEKTGSSTPVEHVLIWEHLSKSGFMSGSFECNTVESNATTPSNPFAVRLQLVWDAVYDPTTGSARHNLKTGNQIPSDLLAEVDRKIDDGSATGGIFRFSSYNGGAEAPVGAGTCSGSTAPHAWSSTTIVANCGAVTLF